MMQLDNDKISRQLVKLSTGLVLLVALSVPAFILLGFMTGSQLFTTVATEAVFRFGGSLLLAAIGLYALVCARRTTPAKRPKAWVCPLLAGMMALLLMMVSYAYLGVWPLGEWSVLLVDMHHQYAPLLSELRNMLLHGGSLNYSDHMGLGANVLPAFAYYLASPLNLLLVFFSESLLAEAVLVITLLKFAGAAASFTACVQGLTHRRDATAVALGLCYAASGYMLAYSWNIMWLDTVALLPAVVLAMENLLKGGKLWHYALLLMLVLLTSYYIGFMVCVFLVLYFIVWVLRQRRTGKELFRGAWRFALGSALGGGLAAWLLVPTAMALGRTSAAGGSLGEFAVNFPLFDLLERFFFGASPTIRSGNLPNLYCGVAAVLLLPLYATLSTVPVRRRLTYGGLLGLLLFSCTLEPMNLLWHGLHAPNDLPYRFSFLTVFVLLLIAGRVLAELPRLKPGAVLGSLAGCAAYLLLWEKLLEAPEAGEDSLAWMAYANLLLLALYAGLLLFTARKRLAPAICRVLVLLVVAAELLVMNTLTLTAMNKNEHYTYHSSYVDNAGSRANAAAISRAQEIAQQAGYAGCRIEFLPRQTCMDNSLHHYSGLTTFASSNPYATTVLMGDLGYAVNGVNSYQYHTFYYPMDSLLGLRYVILEVNLAERPDLKLVDTVAVEGEYRYIYENTRALPIGYCVSNTVRQYQRVEYDPFGSQEEFIGALTGDYSGMGSTLSLRPEEGDGTCNGSAFTKYSSADNGVFYADVTVAGQYYGYVDCRAASSIHVETTGSAGEVQNNWSVTHYEPYIIDLGWLEPGDRVRTTINGTGGLSGHVYVMRLNDSLLEEKLTDLAAGGLNITDYAPGNIRGTVTADIGESLLLTVPYDKGWQVTVDGETAETFPVATLADRPEDGALLGVRLKPGTHDVTFRYRAPGTTAGVLVSLFSALVLAALLLWPRYGRLVLDKLTKKAAPAESAGEEPAENAVEEPAENAVEEPAAE